MAILFTADTHFGDAEALSLYRRPFASVAEMDRELVTRWNEVVSDQDVVWHLGDFAVSPEPGRVDELLGELNGTKHLVIGNHDGAATTDSQGWASIQHYTELEVERVRLVLCHYALRTWRGIVLCHHTFHIWRGMSKGWVNLHGHSHGRLKPQSRQFDVGVDAWRFRPVRLPEVIGKSPHKSGGVTGP
jgi:calcineurin-like phosphoesterase family protein